MEVSKNISKHKANNLKKISIQYMWLRYTSKETKCLNFKCAPPAIQYVHHSYSSVSFPFLIGVVILQQVYIVIQWVQVIMHN